MSPDNQSLQTLLGTHTLQLTLCSSRRCVGLIAPAGPGVLPPHHSQRSQRVSRRPGLPPRPPPPLNPLHPRSAHVRRKCSGTSVPAAASWCGRIYRSDTVLGEFTERWLRRRLSYFILSENTAALSSFRPSSRESTLLRATFSSRSSLIRPATGTYLLMFSSVHSTRCRVERGKPSMTKQLPPLLCSSARSFPHGNGIVPTFSL